MKQYIVKSILNNQSFIRCVGFLSYYYTIISNLFYSPIRIKKLNNYYHILILQNNTQYSIFVPFIKSLFLNSSMFLYEAVYETHTEIINMYPGVPILISADQLGAKEIRVTNTLTDDIKIYKSYEKLF